MHLPYIVKSNDYVFMEWEMTKMFKKCSSSTMYGSTRVALDEEGTILSQRDYFDLWGDIFDNIPWVGRLYRRLMHCKFG